MNIDNRQYETLHTINTDLTPSKDVRNDLIELVEDVIEGLNILKEYLLHGHTMDTTSIASELGDMFWNLAISTWSLALGYDLYKDANLYIENLQSKCSGESFEVDHNMKHSEDDI